MTPSRRLRCALLLGALLTCLMPVVAGSPALADGDGKGVPPGSLTRYGAIEQRASSYLCTGYAACAEAGYFNAGYARVSDKMFWRMYSGHNCTNYAAYRMVKSGLPNERPWSGGGNASQWGLEMSEITDATPAVGAVAWWRANAPGTGSSGHVAYVEQVISPTEIVISEDSWGGDFHWRRLVKADGRWPSGFVHFNDVSLRNVTAPVISGTPQVGQALTAQAGTWSPAGRYAYQWLADGAVVPGATAARFVPAAAQKGKRMTLQVTASKKGYAPVSVRTAAAADVKLGLFRNDAPPVISGVPEVDQVLTVTPGSWTPAPEGASVQWYADGVAIPGARRWSLRLAQPQIDKQITAAVVVRTTAYKNMKVGSAATAPVIAGTIAVTRPFTVRGRTVVGGTLTVVPGAFEPSDANVTYTWLRNGVPIAGANASTYRVSPADVGRRVSLRVDLARATYRSASQAVGIPGPVMTEPDLRVFAKGRPEAALVIVRVTAPGVAHPAGKVTVKIGRQSVVAKVVDGRARVRLEDLRKGPKVVVVRYSGTNFIQRTFSKSRIWVTHG